MKRQSKPTSGPVEFIDKVIKLECNQQQHEEAASQQRSCPNSVPFKFDSSTHNAESAFVVSAFD